MLNRLSEEILDCHERAESCRERARSARSDESRQFWLSQEAHWMRLATSVDLSERIDDYLSAHKSAPVQPQVDERAPFGGLLSVYRRVCDSLDLDSEDETTARTIATTVIEAALHGEDDPEALYQRVLQSILTS